MDQRPPHKVRCLKMKEENVRDSLEFIGIISIFPPIEQGASAPKPGSGNILLLLFFSVSIAFNTKC